MKTGKPELALTPLSKAMEASPDDPKLLLLLGVTKDLAGSHWEAQGYYRNGLVRAPGDPSLTVDLALSLAISGNYPNAISVLQPLAFTRHHPRESTVSDCRLTPRCSGRTPGRVTLPTSRLAPSVGLHPCFRSAPGPRR